MTRQPLSRPTSLLNIPSSTGPSRCTRRTRSWASPGPREGNGCASRARPRPGWLVVWVHSQQGAQSGLRIERWVHNLRWLRRDAFALLRMRVCLPSASAIADGNDGRGCPRMSCRHRIFRVILIHVHIKESRPRLAIRGKGEPEECGRVLLDIVKMLGYSSDTFRHPLNRSPNDGRPKRDPEGHRHPCPSDASLIVRSSQARNSATNAAMPPTRAPRARGTACPPPGQVTPAYTRPHGGRSRIRLG